MTYITVSFIFGGIGLCLSCLAGGCGFPLAIIGFIFGLLAFLDPEPGDTEQKPLSVMAMLLSGLHLLVICVGLICMLLSGMSSTTQNVFPAF